MNQFKQFLSSVIAGSLLAASISAFADVSSAELVANALIHGDRPGEDAVDDARRMPLEVLAFAGIRAGMSIFELEGGGGYYTEILSRTVGPAGSVIVQNPPSFDSFLGDGPANRIANNRLPNVRNTRTNFDELDAPDNSIDMVTWILGPHELGFEPAENVTLGDPADSFAEIVRVLKPGGYLLAVDHIAPANSGIESGGTLHRIREGVVTDLAVAAGLKVVRSSNLLKQENDPLDAGVFDPSIQGKTSKFIVLYRN
jgi:predicted methyltransferase